MRRVRAQAERWATFAVMLAVAGAGRADDNVPLGEWMALEPGLELAVFAAAAADTASTPDASLRVLRIDPNHFALQLLTVSASAQERPLTPREWGRRHNLVAVINAGMYQQDYRTSVSLMRTKAHTNNPRLTRDKAVLAFDRRDDGVPPVQIIDRQAQSFDELSTHYDSLVQSIRMVSLGGTNVWQPQPQRASTAAIGMDRQGRVLFIHASTPMPTHDLINVLLALPIELRNAMYVEGGPEAQLYVRGGGHELELAGQFDTGMIGSVAHTGGWPVPNVIGVTRIAAGGAGSPP